MNNLKLQLNISEKVLNEIQNKNVKPKPRWHFRIYEITIWSLGTITTICGAVAISTTLFVIAIAPIKFEPVTHDNIVRFWIEFVPVLWLVLFACFVIATDYTLQKTKRGYRYGLVFLTLSSIILSIILGYIGFLLGIGEVIETKVGDKIPFHSSSQMMIQKIWYHPERGLLIGTVDMEHDLILTAKNGEMFTLDISDIPEYEKKYFNNSSIVSIIGTSTATGDFFVCMILPIQSKDLLQDEFKIERNLSEKRTNTCKGVRPYDRFKNNILNYEN